MVMGLKTKTGLGFIIVLGFFIAVVIFGNIVTPPLPPPKEERTTAALEGFLAQTISEPTRYVNPATSGEEINATKNIAALIGKQIVDLNPEGTRSNTLRVKNAEAIAQEAFEQSMKNFDPSYFTPEIKQEGIIVSKTQDPETYRAATKQIIMDIQANFYPKKDDEFRGQLQALAERYKKAAQELYALTAPKTLADEHKKTIQMVIGKQRILEKAADYEADPINAMLALNLWKTAQ